MSNNVILLLAPEDTEEKRLDQFLAALLPQYSREYLKQLILSGKVFRGPIKQGSVITKPSHPVLPGQEWTVRIPKTVSLDLAPETIRLDIVYEDVELLVVNKPAGMLTHPTGREYHGTLVNALLAHCKDGLSGINGIERPGIIHRLDRDTSGLLMIAKSDRAHRDLQQQLQERTAKRCYRAIVQRIMPNKSGTVDAPIGRNPKNRDKMAVVSNGRPAITHWEMVESIGSQFSILKLTLETGRTHQIRVHMAHIGHPIFGDPLYGSGVENILKFKPGGQILQAYQLAFVHPVSDKAMCFEIPPDNRFSQAVRFLESRYC